VEATAIAQLTAYVQANYGGDAHACFLAYASPDGNLTHDGLTKLLTDAGVHFFIVSDSGIASLVIKEVDTDGDGEISWAEALAAQGLLPTSTAKTTVGVWFNDDEYREMNVEPGVMPGDRKVLTFTVGWAGKTMQFALRAGNDWTKLRDYLTQQIDGDRL
jgi:hypothetical protein